MSIRRHLVLLLSIVALALLGLGGSAMLQFQKTSALMRSLTQGAMPAYLATVELGSALKSLQIDPRFPISPVFQWKPLEQDIDCYGF